jgi:hypothetical protein
MSSLYSASAPVSGLMAGAQKCVLYRAGYLVVRVLLRASPVGSTPRGGAGSVTGGTPRAGRGTPRGCAGSLGMCNDFLEVCVVVEDFAELDEFPPLGLFHVANEGF